MITFLTISQDKRFLLCGSSDGNTTVISDPAFGE